MGTALSKNLIPSDLIVQIGTDEQVTALSTSASYVPSIRVFDGTSKPVKEGQLPVGEIAIYKSGSEFIKLGKELNCLVIGYRPRASIMDGGNAPQNFFDAETEQFKLVEEKAKAGIQNYQAGLEYLLYIPGIKDFNGFVVLFLGNKSGRRESPNLRALVGKAATLKSEFVKAPKHSWWCAKVLPCTTPFEPPAKAEIVKAIDLFKKAIPAVEPGGAGREV